MLAESSLLIPHRFCGPPNSANGGYAAGALAQFLLGEGSAGLGQAVEVVLHQPPPLEEEIEVRTQVNDNGENSAEALFGERLCASAVVTERPLQAPPFVAFRDADDAGASFPGHLFHPFPSCFTCGIERPDGLQIHPGIVAGKAGEPPLMAGSWTPSDWLGADIVPNEILWAALDCIGAWSTNLSRRLIVLGTMTTQVEYAPAIGTPLVAVGRALATEGRKTGAHSALYTARGELVAFSSQIWVAVNPQDFRSDH